MAYISVSSKGNRNPFRFSESSKGPDTPQFQRFRPIDTPSPRKSGPIRSQNRFFFDFLEFGWSDHFETFQSLISPYGLTTGKSSGRYHIRFWFYGHFCKKSTSKTDFSIGGWVCFWKTTLTIFFIFCMKLEANIALILEKTACSRKFFSDFDFLYYLPRYTP